ncbi:hypothetical protein Cgig2_033629 [Carnegiea gigantea]|uniref:Reverse transcriptase zinc-binding domain-containing protein n=1 Tax=Carnegiea gigantea TaxID=171969 RepID=A0A9Q1QB18_9CARY|nr:hypothetical protein Cgig2_033629 [Carnegiea gigantea]
MSSNLFGNIAHHYGVMSSLRKNTLSPQEIDLVNRFNKKIKRNANGDPVNHDTETTHMDIKTVIDEGQRQWKTDNVHPPPRTSFRIHLQGTTLTWCFRQIIGQKVGNVIGIDQTTANIKRGSYFAILEDITENDIPKDNTKDNPDLEGNIIIGDEAEKFGGQGYYTGTISHEESMRQDAANASSSGIRRMDTSEMDILRAGSQLFLNTIKEFVRRYDPYVLAFMETKVSGNTANDVCHKISFSGAHRVEAQETNAAFLTKLDWGLLLEKDKLWPQVLRTKYCKNQCDIDMFERKTDASNGWHGILENVQNLKAGIRTEVGNGKMTKFWFSRALIDDPRCKGCLTDEEIIVHLVQDCRLVREVWLKLHPPSGSATFFSLPLRLGSFPISKLAIAWGPMDYYLCRDTMVALEMAKQDELWKSGLPSTLSMEVHCHKGY